MSASAEVALSPPPAATAAVGIRRTGYLQQLDFYPGHFQALLALAAPPVRVRAMKRWISIGRDATPPVVPPLDDPPRLKDWWTRHMANRVPDWICALAATAGSAPPIEVAVGPLFEVVPDRKPDESPAPPVVPPTVGYASALQRVRAAEAAAGELYTSLVRRASSPMTDDVLRARLTAEAEQARRSWDELGDRLRAMERDAEKILSASGRMWMVDDVIAANTLVHQVLRESVRGLLRRVRPKLVGKALTEQDSIWVEEVDVLFSELRTNKFTAPARTDVDDTAA